MDWIKKDSVTTIKEVVERNTGMTISEFASTRKTPITNLSLVADRIKQIAYENKIVTVFGDYDCDGITSSVILHMVLSRLKIKHEIVLPKRSNGYGLKTSDVKDIKTDVIITVDNGIAAYEAVETAKAKGIEVIIIDHHLAPAVLPNADIIVDPHILKNEGDFDCWCGAGLSYRLCTELFGENDTISQYALQFAAIGTVADVVDLVKDNRSIVKKGLELINHTKVESLKVLIDKAVATANVDETTIGFTIGPIINAASRVEDDAKLVYDFFISGDPDICDKLIDINEKRKLLVAESMNRAYEIIGNDSLYGDFPLVIYDSETIEGIAGIIAGRIAEDMHIPVIILTDSSDETIVKGSARSPSINIKETLDSVNDVLLGYGGHTGAAGLSLCKNRIDELRGRFSEMYSDVTIEEPKLTYDLEIDASDLSSIIDELLQYAPFGQGNHRPIFKINGYDLSPRMGTCYKTIGEDGQTLKLFGNGSSAIGFGMVEKYNLLKLPRSLNLLGKLSINNFAGKSESQVELIDFVSNVKIPEKSSLAKMLEEKLKLI